jgi:hypothetical protein
MKMAMNKIINNLMILSLLDEKEKEAFGYFLAKGSGKHNSHQMIKELGIPKFGHVKNLRKFFNDHPQYGYKIIGHGAYDKLLKHGENYLEFFFP